MASHRTFEFGINAFDSAIRVQCGNSEIRDTLDRYLFPPLPRSNVPAPDVTLSVESIDQGFRVVLDEKIAASANTLHDAARAAIKALDDLLVHRMKTLRAVHAGAVIVDERALLIPGSTHAGKSSLVAELLRRGASHLSDEYALIDEKGLVYPYPRPLLLRNGDPVQLLVLPEELGSKFASQPAPAGWIIALSYEPESDWNIHQISQSDAVMLLLRNTPHEIAQAPEIMDCFLRVVAAADCYEGTRGDAAPAASLLFDLLSSK